jgi:glycosyltransferase involved in cell wall biosynthesis
MGRSKELAAAVIALLRSPALRDRLGQAGREAALKHFSPKKHAALIARVFHDVVL